MGWLYRKWHAECPGTPPAPLHSGGIRPGPLAGQTASSANVCQWSWLLKTQLTFPNSFLLIFLSPWKSPKKTKLISPLLNLPHMIFDLPLLTKSTGKKLSSVKLSKGTKAARSIYFPLHSFSSGLKVSAESRAEQVWLGDDLHLHRISAAPPGGVGRMTLFGCTCTQWLRAKPFMLIHWVNESCEVVLIRGV